ncbi:hypothetical protein GQ600_5964 [Phytophthora cactorum]|nr:hypothetical protein GQ600_5964 [Phytophthora cactorum]
MSEPDGKYIWNVERLCQYIDVRRWFVETVSNVTFIGPLPLETKRSGHSKYTSPELRGVIREFVIAENEATRPITAQLIANHVAKVMEKKNKIPVRRLLRRIDDDEDDVDDGGYAGDEAYCSSGNDDADDQVVIYSFQHTSQK